MIALVFLAPKMQIGIVFSLVISQLLLFLPTVVFLIGTRTNPFRLIQHKKIRPTTALMIVGFTFLCMPLIMLVNMISMLFVDNAVDDMMGMILSKPALLMIFLIGVLGPVSEEFVFRGVIYHSYRCGGRIIGGMFLSALLFGLTHLNFNQMSYAIVVGVIGVMLIECTGSIVSSMIFHMVINLSNVIPVFLLPETYAESGTDITAQLEMLQMTYTEYMCVEIAIFLVIAVISVALALCLLYAITRREGRMTHIKAVFSKGRQGEKERLWSVPLIISIALCLAYMTFDVMLYG